MKNHKKYTRTILITVAVVAAAAALFAFFSPGRAAALNVSDIISDPAAFTGTITVTGIVAGVSQLDPTVFGMMDVKELQCSKPGCNKVYLPFKAAGYVPARGDEVRVTGGMANVDGGYLFIAESVKVVRNHRIGG